MQRLSNYPQSTQQVYNFFFLRVCDQGTCVWLNLSSLWIISHTRDKNVQISEFLLIINFVIGYRARYNLCKIEEIN